jgi:hypothetical protein
MVRTNREMDDQYSEEEAQRRTEAALRAAFKDIYRTVASCRAEFD